MTIAPPITQQAPDCRQLLGASVGFAIDSTIGLYSMRSGGGARLAIAEESLPAPEGDLLQEWPAQAGRRAIRLHAFAGGYEVHTETLGTFRVLPSEGTILVPPTDDHLRREATIFSTPIALCTAAGGDIALHAASVAFGSSAVLIVAAGGGGKSTTAAAFHKAGFRLLADDFTRCSVGKEPLAFPGPAMVRLRPEPIKRLRLPDVSPIGRQGGKVFLGISPKRRGTGDPVPLRGILFLAVGSERPRLEQLRSAEALALLWRQSFFVPTAADRERAFSGLASLVAKVPAWTLRRQLRIEELRPTVDLVATTFAG